MKQRAISNCVALFAWLFVALPYAHAIAPYTRTTGASCDSCHVVNKRLTPLGEAFRRNGHRMSKAWSDTTAVEEPSDAVDIPLSLGLQGAATAYPQRDASAAQQQPVIDFSLLSGNVSILFGRGLTDTVTAYVDVPGAGRGFNLDDARVFFTDIGGASHLFNIWLGVAPAQLTSFGAHASYFNDALIPSITEPVQVESDDTVDGPGPGVEVFGIAAHRFGYALGAQGTFGGQFSAPYAYARVSYKLGGLSLDGEEGLTEVEAPWSETALTVDLFAGYTRATGEQFVGNGPQLLTDNTLILGANIDGQWTSFNMDVGGYYHEHSTGEQFYSIFAEPSFVFTADWVASLRFDYLHMQTGVTDLRLVPGVLWALFPHTTLGLSAQLEVPVNVPANTGGAFYDFGDPLGFTIANGANIGFALQNIMLWLSTSI